ncbi:MAG TPA: hypothetical protein VJ813_04700 [Vicinamibacterales bacterium]|nr:hypothetical protein [Vicinamibacterales bacterium]
MKLKTLLIALCVLWLPPSPGAQAPTAPADPISGTWNGYMARDTNRQPITVALKFDGKVVSGTITGPPSPGTIRTGTFEPATGVLKFEVVVQDDAKTIALFDGKVVNGTATGRVTIGNGSGTFNVTKGATDPSAAALQRSFVGVGDNVMKAAALVPADKYSYRPTESVRTFGQLLAHVADGYNYYCANAASRKVQWSDATEKGITDKAGLATALQQATDACNAAYAGSGQIGSLIENIGHTNLHYGNMITYMRMLGLVPPSS